MTYEIIYESDINLIEIIHHDIISEKISAWYHRLVLWLTCRWLFHLISIGEHPLLIEFEI